MWKLKQSAAAVGADAYGPAKQVISALKTVPGAELVRPALPIGCLNRSRPSCTVQCTVQCAVLLPLYTPP